MWSGFLLNTETSPIFDWPFAQDFPPAILLKTVAPKKKLIIGGAAAVLAKAEADALATEAKYLLIAEEIGLKINRDTGLPYPVETPTVEETYHLLEQTQGEGIDHETGEPNGKLANTDNDKDNVMLALLKSTNEETDEETGEGTNKLIFEPISKKDTKTCDAISKIWHSRVGSSFILDNVSEQLEC